MWTRDDLVPILLQPKTCLRGRRKSNSGKACGKQVDLHLAAIWLNMGPILFFERFIVCRLNAKSFNGLACKTNRLTAALKMEATLHE